MASRKDRKCFRCPALIYRDSITGLCATCLNEQRSKSSPSAAMTVDRELRTLQMTHGDLKKRYDQALKTIGQHEQSLAAVAELEAGLDTFKIAPHKGSGTSEGTVVVAASDWHSEERVTPGQVSGLNEFNLEVAEKRAVKFFQSTLRLTRLLQQDITIDRMVLALLGDFITNELHDADSAENNQLTPMAAIVFAQRLLVSGMEFLLNNSKLSFVVPCHSGNHARTTKKVRIAQENGHSLEFLMYHNLAGHFRNEKRVQFVIPEGYHSYVEVYGQTLRFHHGHDISYQGGVGGIFIPAFKAIAQWNKARRADLDIFGHFHQTKDGGNFRSNGSLIGYNSYALAIKADYEPPYQTLFLMDKKRGRTCTWPLMLEAPRA